MAFNIVELMTAESDDCAFDQACKFGHRVEGHAVYCHNDDWDDGPRKCRRSWYTGGEVKDEDCPGFQPNPDFKGSMNPTTIDTPLCSRCAGTKLVRTDRNRVETCPRCMGGGSEPTAMELTTYEQDVLELGLVCSGRCDAQHEFYVCIAESKQEDDSVHKLIELDLVEMRSMSFAKGGVAAYLLKVTCKGEAVVHANWAKEEG